MENYQLYRTNVLLGGQLKWDLILESDSSKFFIKDFHLTPISKNMPFDKKSDDDLLNYSHQENIKNFYNKVKDSFYDNFEDADFKNNWPIIIDKNEKINPYYDEFNMGCTRSVNYNLYNKQFEFFCPIWLEQLSNNDSLVFIFNIKSINNKIIASKLLSFDINEYITHNKFVNYFNNYINYLGLDTGDDRLIELNFNKHLAKLSGLRIDSGNINQQNINDLTCNLLNRERPLMESDNFIIEKFREYKYIAKQLFNFNLCFNLEDILSYNLSNSLYGKKIKIEVNVGIKKHKTLNNNSNIEYLDFLKKADFYSNYEYIQKKKCGFINKPDLYKKNLNVLEYLKDYKCIDLIDKNKYIQNIIHWSLSGNNDYIFNIYEGFSGYSLKDNKNNIYHSHLYDNSADLTQDKYSATLNNTGWCNMIQIDNYRYLNNVLSYKYDLENIYASDFSINKNQNYLWVNNIKYKNNLNFDKEDIKHLKLLLNHITPSLLKTFKSQFIEIKLDSDNDVLYIYPPKQDLDFLMFFTDNLNNFTFAKIKKYIYKYTHQIENINNNSQLYKLMNLLNSILESVIYTTTINFNNSLILNKAKGPSYSIDEIEYFKNNNNFNYMYRYDGNIKPTFIIDGEEDINFNYLYYKDYISDNRSFNELSNLQKSNYSKYSNSGFNPIYKSIDYCSIKNIPILNYIDIPNIKVSEFKEPISLINSPEYKWFNNGVQIFLIPIINTTLYSIIDDNGNYIKLEILVKKFIKDYYKLNDDKLVDFIYSKYNIENNFEYKNDNDIINYKYNVKLTLK